MLVSINTSMVFVEACMLLDFSIQLHVAAPSTAPLVLRILPLYPCRRVKTSRVCVAASYVRTVHSISAPLALLSLALAARATLSLHV